MNWLDEKWGGQRWEQKFCQREPQKQKLRRWGHSSQILLETVGSTAWQKQRVKEAPVELLRNKTETDTGPVDSAI